MLITQKRIKMDQEFVDSIIKQEKYNANLRADAAEAKLVEVRGLYTGLKDFDLIEVQKLQAILNRAEPEKGDPHDQMMDEIRVDVENK